MPKSNIGNIIGRKPERNPWMVAVGALAVGGVLLFGFKTVKSDNDAKAKAAVAAHADSIRVADSTKSAAKMDSTHKADSLAKAAAAAKAKTPAKKAGGKKHRG